MSHKKKETKRSGGGDDQDIAAISEDELRLSRKEKLQEISDKFEELCSKCTAAGLGNASVRKLAGSFVGCREQNKRKTRERRLIAYFLVVALACAAFYCDTSYDWISAHARLASIQVRDTELLLCIALVLVDLIHAQCFTSQIRLLYCR